MGRVLFYLLWPLMWFYAPLVIRGRAVVIVNDEILAVKNWLGPGKWQLPGGGLKFGERPLDAINRELHEELDLTGLHGRLLLSEPIAIRSGGLLLRQMYAVYRLDKRPPISISKELTEYDWMPIEDAPLDERIRQLL